MEQFDNSRLSHCEMQFIIQHFPGQSSGNVSLISLALHIHLVNQSR